ncbi:AAA family ATPase [Bacillus wiedmannii]|uniref:AAA family ATPase n=1 Tax=Bacillus wiedmannii TaxID=1890302 RepID=UPI003D1AD6D7
MNYLIKEISLNNEKYAGYVFEKDTKKISNLSKINIFVGTNNSGKSRMLRNLFIENPTMFTPSGVDLEKVNTVINEFKQRVTSSIVRNNIVDYDDIISDLNNLHNITYVVEGEEYLSELHKQVQKLLHINGSKNVSTSGVSYGSTDYEGINNNLRGVAEDIIKEVDQEMPQKYSFHKVYIPTLRGLRTLEGNDNPYLQRTKVDYFGGQEQVDVFTGLDLYQEVKNLLLGSLEDREKITEFQEFLGRVFFDGQQVTLVPSIKSDVLYVKIGEEREQAIHNLGDGIQSIIILTFPLFKYRDKNLLMFIEEPELYLHPGLQRKLLETMMCEGDNHFQYFITTHSNHFLDLTLDIEQISIYSFHKELDDSEQKEKDAKFMVENVSNEDNNVLEMLGVRNSSVFLSNCTIWVEGITDRYYLRHFLKLYIDSVDKEFEVKEDFHFSFVEYSGNNITHWSFLDDEGVDGEPTYSSMNVDRLCSRLLLITDKDSEKKLSRQQKLAEKLRDRYYCLNCKEIENVLAKHVLLKVIADYEKVSVEELEFTSDFTERGYRNQYLGKFIDEKLVNKRRRGSYGSTSGTVSDKVLFCKKAISHINSIDDLSEEAKALCEKIYQFIKSNNE